MITTQANIGLIAGNGQFPLLFSRAAKAAGVQVFAVAMQGETDPAIEHDVHWLKWVRVGQLGAMIRAFQSQGIVQAAMAGGVRKTRLFGHMRPDLTGLKVLARSAIRPDDGMLRAIAHEFERAGITIVPSTRYMPDALAPKGILTHAQPDTAAWQDLRYGLHIARTIGQLDIGQTVIVKDGAVVALEAIEGTDACIARAGGLIGHKGGTMVKVAKPLQDMRFDVPAVGVQTLHHLQEAGIAILGLEAERTLILEPDAFIACANTLGLVVVGLHDGLL